MSIALKRGDLERAIDALLVINPLGRVTAFEVRELLTALGINCPTIDINIHLIARGGVLARRTKNDDRRPYWHGLSLRPGAVKAIIASREEMLLKGE